MNKRARLSRRILREHREGAAWHHEQMPAPVWLTTWRIWKCPHCPGYNHDWGLPRAYR